MNRSVTVRMLHSGKRSLCYASRHLAALLLACISISLIGCGNKSEQEKIDEYNKKLGPQGQYADHQLIIHWPTSGFFPKDDSVSLKIPSEFLDRTPIEKDKKGISRIYFAFPYPSPLFRPAPKAAASVAEAIGPRARVFVVLGRDTWYGQARSDTYREQGQNRDRYHRDADIAGLERYSRLYCFRPDELEQPAVRQTMAAKEADDPSPPHCRINRHQAILTTPPQASHDSESVSIVCESTGCTAYFLAGQRLGETGLTFDELPKWKEIIQPVQKKIDSFIISKPAN